MIFISSFILLVSLLIIDVNCSITCDLTKSDKIFFDATGLEWKCSEYCPRIRGCMQQCCPPEKDKEEDKAKDKEEKNVIVDNRKGSLSRESPKKVAHVSISPAMGVIIALMICIIVGATVGISSKLSKILNKTRSRDIGEQECLQNSANQASHEDIASRRVREEEDIRHIELQILQEDTESLLPFDDASRDGRVREEDTSSLSSFCVAQPSSDSEQQPISDFCEVSVSD